MLHEPCGKCGRTLLTLRHGASREAMRGSAPLCSVPACPLVEKVLGFAAPKIKGLELHGPSPPAVFVGRRGYPDVSIGPLLPATPELAPALSDSPEDWKKLDIATILALRARLYRSKSPVRVTAPASTHAMEASRDLAMAARPVDAEVTLKKPLRVAPEAQVDAFAAPMGPSVDVVDARVLSNPSVPRKVDALVSDVHADAATAIHELYDAGIPTHHVQRLLSVGLLGEGSRRRLVPTRWSITATDDILGKQIAEDVKGFPLVDAPAVHAADLFGNYFQILLLPRPWSYEMIEAWQEENGGWAMGRDAEGHRGRTAYADNIAGGYYAARLPVLEHLQRIRRQAAVFVHREITDDYWAPLGVWVLREAVKAAMESKGLVFGDVESAVRHMLRRSRDTGWLRIAALPKEVRVQRTLRDFGG